MTTPRRAQHKRGQAENKVVAKVITAEDARREIDCLLKTVNMTRDELESRGDAWLLDADERGVLSDVKGLEFLLRHAKVPVSPTPTHQRHPNDGLTTPIVVDCELAARWRPLHRS